MRPILTKTNAQKGQKTLETLDKIKLASEESGKKPPILIAASKTRSKDEIFSARKLGISHFGENYVQEALEKRDAFEGCSLHLIGHLQTNKAKMVPGLFQFFHGLDSIRLAKALEKELAAANETLSVFIQVNLAGEAQKGGISKHNLQELITHVRHHCPHLLLVGLMTLPPAAQNPRPYFEKLARLACAYNIGGLSMGMSDDWQQAIKAGATHIRLGTALFGPRTPFRGLKA